MTRTLALAVLASAAACAQPAGQVESLATEAGNVSVVEVQGDLERPWGIAFLPDGRMLVTERPGRLRIVDPASAGPPATVGGTPTVWAQGQGGLLDVALDPDFDDNQSVYLTYAAPGPGGSAATAVGRGVFQGDSLAAFERLWIVEPSLVGPNHFGSRIAFGPEGHLFVSTGERFQFEPAQDLDDHLGTVVRLHRDGSVPLDNPFVDTPGAQPEVWSYGHRNVQSLGVHPETGTLWEAEFGPLGGDELNRIERGINYGWPTVSWGSNYDGSPIPDPPARPDLEDAVRHWTPAISPSGLAFYTADVFPEWTGSLMLGSLTKQGVVRLALDGDRVVGEETLPLGARIRDVEQGPDGMVYVLVDQADGAVWRLEPLEDE